MEGKAVGHNYGHGGSGITMSWGSSAEILDMLSPWLQQPTSVAVLGAGIMGLCSASLLLDGGHSVTVYAAAFPPHTTSNIAGGLWAPTHVGLGAGGEESARHDRILRRSWEHFRRLDGGRFGVEEIPLFETDDRLTPLDPMPPGLTAAPTRLERLPFSGLAPSGQVSSTLLVETPRFLAALMDELRGRGASFVEQEVGSFAEALALPQPVLVNSLGLGARRVPGDPLVSPIRGQLVMLEPAPRPFFMDHAFGYVISRRDALLLGGTFEEGEEEAAPVERTCLRILEQHRLFFGES